MRCLEKQNSAVRWYKRQVRSDVYLSGKPERQKYHVPLDIARYALLLSEQIFLPLTTEDRDIIYAPFQCMAEYFLQKGYIGIVYSSTVFPDGKNIVLFDKNAAIPYGEIKRITV